MVQIRNFQESLEKDLTRLSKEIKERANTAAVERLPEKELVKQSLQAVIAQTSVPPTPKDEVKSPALPDYLQVGDPRAKEEVERLVDLVFRENLTKAVREAKHQPPFIEDSFHDALVDRLLPELKKRGVLK